MCEFVSWKEIEVEGKVEVRYLRNEDLDAKRGKELLNYSPEDIEGHGAIEFYYEETKGKGVNKECTDFSTPNNFPKEIVKDLKAGKLSRIGIALDILNEKGKKEYEKIKGKAYEEYRKIDSTAWEEYRKIQSKADKEYREKVKTAYFNIVKQKKYRVKVWK